MRRTRAFTLIELLIVIGIIALLVSLAFAIGSKVRVTGRVHASLQAIGVLDSSVEQYQAEKAQIPGAVALDPRSLVTVNPPVYQPVADARNMSGGTPGAMIDSVALYIHQGRGVAAVRDTFKQLDSRLTREHDPDGPGAGWDTQAPLQSVFDAFGNPMRYVHPAFDGTIYGPWASPSNPAAGVQVTQVAGNPPNAGIYGITDIRRNNDPANGGDSDGGICKGGTPYFYSCGPDGDPTTVADNVYSTKPEVQKN